MNVKSNNLGSKRVSDNLLGVKRISNDLPKTVINLVESKIKEIEVKSEKEFSKWLADHNLFIINGEVIEKETMDYRMRHYIVDGFFSTLPKNPEDAQPYWTDGNQVLSKNEDDVNYLADFFDGLGFSAKTGYYDPEEDERNDEIDRFTGFYYMLV